MKTKLITLILGLGLFAWALIFANAGTLESESMFENVVFTPAVVTDVLEDHTFTDPSQPDSLVGSLVYEVRIRGGERDGEYTEARFHITRMGQRLFEPGDRVVIRYTIWDGVPQPGDLINRDRTTVLVGMIVAFLAVLLVLGGKTGLKTVASLLFTVLSILFILNPLLLRGFPAVPTTLALLFFVTVFVLIMLSGLTKKTLVAALATMFGVLCAAVASSLAGWLTSINGFNTENIGFLVHASAGNGIDIDASGLFISGVLIASLGAVLDTAMSIASGAWELKQANPSVSRAGLLKASYNIGKDLMGTMANTLILAFAGSSLNLLLTMSALQIGFHEIINNDGIGIEIIRSLGGSLGIALTVPAVAWFASLIYVEKSPKVE